LGGTPVDHRTAMAAALDAAREALAAGEVPVGAAVWQASRLLAVAGNRREQDQDPCGHAEIIALRKAAKAVGDWRMPEGTWLSVTLEPCPMCAYAIREARVSGVAYGADDPRRGAAGSLYHLLGDPRLGPAIPVVAGVEVDAASALLERFFAERRGSFGGGVSEPG
jgi:tRNA(adenine34) deaminase